MSSLDNVPYSMMGADCMYFLYNELIAGEEWLKALA